MKTLYTSPVITVEELTKADVLCASTETMSAQAAQDLLANNPNAKFDNANQKFSTLADFSNFM